MSNVDIPFGKSASDTAVLLLLAAQELDLDPSVVKTQPMQNRFSVPIEVGERAFPDSKDTSKDKPVAKKAPAKKTAAKKTAAKKTAPKKAATNRSDSK